MKRTKKDQKPSCWDCVCDWFGNCIRSLRIHWRKIFYISCPLILFILFITRHTLLKKISGKEDMLSLCLTGIIALSTGAFALFQYFSLKKRDIIKLHMLYNHIISLLKSKWQDINAKCNLFSDIDNTFMKEYVKEFKISEDTLSKVDKLEALLYERGEYSNVDFTKSVIETTNAMRQTIQYINFLYKLLRQYPQDLASNEEILQQLQEKINGSINQIEAFRTEIQKLV